MNQQELWNSENYKLHNFQSDEESTQAAPILPIFESLDDIKTEDIEVQIKETPITPTPIKKKKPEKNKNTIKVLCLPASFQQIIDPVYGETKTNLSYGTQFSFDCEVESINDLTCKIRTNLTNVERQSILFFPKERRWWKVSSVEHYKDELLLNCMPSDIQPSFT